MTKSLLSGILVSIEEVALIDDEEDRLKRHYEQIGYLPPLDDATMAILSSLHSLPDRSGDNLFHSILRIPADEFQDGKGEVIKSLLRSGADPVARNRLGDNILHILAGSTERESHDLLSFLLDVCHGRRPAGTPYFGVERHRQ
jgi:hypothetical protein